ncbi:nephrin [Nephila pilipes]|uniref:Nephrin n=1 Tax=Nephila pilipes TaxID=299642 RepID=A0A8X6U7Q0_NEPPI|nr:nephrin [Nephila pilipes]
MTVIGVAGSPVNLPCNITPPGEEDAEDAIALVLWYKDESTTPIYSLDARQGSLDQARHAAKDSLNARAHLSISERPAFLKLDPVMMEDEGEYKCRADFKKARTRYMSVFLKVVVPPSKPVITDRNKEVLQSLIGPYNEGEPLMLICEVIGGQPVPTVTWWRESVLLDDTYDINPNGVIRNELLISSLQRHDLMAVLSCQASNNNVSLPMSSSVTVDMNFRPLDVMIEGDRQPLSAHKTVELVCRATGSRPPAVISWWKGTSKLKALKDNISVDGNVTTSIITMTPSSEDNGKHLSCRAENPLIAGSAIEYGWKLEVHYIPQLTLRLGSKLRHSHIQEGNDVYLDCSIIASPWVNEIGWRFGGKELHTNTSAGIIVSNQSLVLQKVQRTSRGHYTCVASNSEGEGESNVVQLRVQYSPLCKPGQKVVYGAARHEAVNVLCEVEADPRQVNFHWEFNSSSDNLQVLRFVPEGLRSVATYIPRTEQDYGTLLCFAENSVGRQKEPCVYIVVPAGPPDPVQNCFVTNQTEDSFRVECSEGYDGGVSQHFVLEVYDAVNNVLQTNKTSNEPLFNVKGLLPGTDYLIIVYAMNSKGRSESIALRTSTLTTPESLTRVGKLATR